MLARHAQSEGSAEAGTLLSHACLVWYLSVGLQMRSIVKPSGVVLVADMLGREKLEVGESASVLSAVHHTLVLAPGHVATQKAWSPSSDYGGGLGQLHWWAPSLLWPVLRPRLYQLLLCLQAACCSVSPCCTVCPSPSVAPTPPHWAQL